MVDPRKSATVRPLAGVSSSAMSRKSAHTASMVSEGFDASNSRALDSRTPASTSIGTYVSAGWRSSRASSRRLLLRESPLPSSTTRAGAANMRAIAAAEPRRISVSARVIVYSGSSQIAVKSALPSGS